MISSIKNATDESEFGEQASKLARIAQSAAELGHEVHVSDGFVLSFSEFGSMLEPLKDAAGRIISSSSSAEEKSVQMRQLLANRSTSESMRSDIIAKYKGMITDLFDQIPQEAHYIVTSVRGKPPVDIRGSIPRSSALSTAVFQNVVGDENLLYAIMRCWCSIFSASSISSIRSLDDVKVAVVVQKSLRFEKTGSFVTDEPISGNFSEDEIVLLDDIGNRIQSLFGSPQLMEFGFLRGRVVIRSCLHRSLQEPEEKCASMSQSLFANNNTVQENTIQESKPPQQDESLTKVVSSFDENVRIETPSQLVRLRKNADSVADSRILFDVARLNALMTGSDSYSISIDDSLILLLKSVLKSMDRSNMPACDNFYISEENIRKLIEAGFEMLVVGEESLADAKRLTTTVEKKILMEMYRERHQ